MIRKDEPSTKRKPVIALVLAAVFLLSGCGSGAFSGMLDAIQNAGNVGDQWINSEIYGAIDETTPTDPKDDFFTAVNKGWILAQDSEKQEPAIQLDNPEEVLERNMLRLIRDPESTGYLNNTSVGMTPEEIAHVGQLVSVFFAAAGDMKTRNSLGVEPLRPFVDRISEISNLDEFTDYLLDFDGANIWGAPLTEIMVTYTFLQPDMNRVCILPIDESHLMLGKAGEYVRMTPGGVVGKEICSQITGNLLEKLGFSKQEIRKTLRDCYTFETLVSDNLTTGMVRAMRSYEEEHGGEYQPAQLQELFGDYPILDILQAYGFHQAETYLLYQPEYAELLSKLYCEDNLELLKAYYIAHTVYLCSDLLDSASFNESAGIADRKTGPTDDLKENPDLAMDDEAVTFLLDKYVNTYLTAPFQMLYISAFCNGEQKAGIEEMTTRIRAALREILQNSEWISEQGRANALEKLDCMTVRALFPDHYISYQGLRLSSKETLPEMVRDTRIYAIRKDAAKIDTPLDRSIWDLSVMPTTIVNAYNEVSLNSIAILAGIVSDDFVFDADAAIEVNLGRLGTIIGHELTHGFDSNGCNYDKYGIEYPFEAAEKLLTKEDKAEFTKRVSNLTNWYTALTPLPDGAPYLSIAGISAEAIADLGGMKCALLAASQEPDFDYDLFFRSYAEQWRKVNSLEDEKLLVQADSHPLAFLRVNVVLSQYDEFLKTYDVQPGDGMYFAPDARILVW